MLRALENFASRLGLTAARCPICSAITDRNNGGLCPTCAVELRPHLGGHCPQCGAMFGDENTPPTLCGECHLTPLPWDRLYFHGRYSGPLRDLILSYKFNGGVGRTRLLSDLALAAFGTNTERIPDAIIPVPLHTRRLLWRGFNQSTELALALGKALNRPVLKSGLIRTRHTIPQTQLGMKDRQTNIKDAFAADEKGVRGKTILVVDDVYTTGATLTECTRTLNRAGASGVDVLVVARTQQEPV
ncbi:MAG: ComF family protein [Pseudodesulfovibrio sp.]